MIFSCLSSVLIIIAVVCLFALTPERVTDDLMQLITPNDTMRDKSRNLRGNKKTPPLQNACEDENRACRYG